MEKRSLGEEEEDECCPVLKREKFKLYRYEELPAFLQDNEYIRTGYRALYTYQESWASIFMFHNDTGNIWTHLAPALFMLAMVFQSWHGAPFWDRLAFSGFFFSGFLCFIFSSLLHTHHSNSKRAYIRWGCLDYAGISVLICGCCCLVTYFLFYQLPGTRIFWISLIVGVSSVGVVGPAFDVWRRRQFRVWRTLVYVASGVVGALPFIHFICIYGFPHGLNPQFYVYFALMALFNLGGAAIYVTRVPERFFPGRFDYVGHSHQWWHLAVFIAALFHYKASLVLAEWTYSKLNLL